MRLKRTYWGGVLCGAALTTAIVGILAAFSVLPGAIESAIWKWANSVLSITLIATFVAAFAGTWGAQVLAERTGRQDRLLTEIQGVNFSLALLFNIANAYIGTKKQLTSDILAKYDQDVARFDEHKRKIRLGEFPRDEPFRLSMELRLVHPPYTPAAELQHALQDRLYTNTKPIVLLTPLLQSINGLALTFSERNAWIDHAKEHGESEPDRFSKMYLGAAFSEGRIDETYPSLMKAIRRQLDDCIAFSLILMKALKRHGDELATRSGIGAPKIINTNFREAGDLIPDMKPYSEWVRFVETSSDDKALPMKPPAAKS